VTEQLPAGEESLPPVWSPKQICHDHRIRNADTSGSSFQKRRKESLLRRPRPESKLDHLMDDQHVQLCEWLLTTMTYPEIVKRVQDEFSISTTTKALSHFYMHHVAAHVIQGRNIARNVANKIKKDIEKHPGTYDQCTLDALTERVHKIALDHDGNPKHLKLYVDAIARLRTLGLAETDLNLKLRRLAMMERREKRAVKALEDNKLSPEQVARNLREIFQK
jgi:hypothetical protein